MGGGLRGGGSVVGVWYGVPELAAARCAGVSWLRVLVVWEGSVRADRSMAAVPVAKHIGNSLEPVGWRLWRGRRGGGRKG